MTRPIRRRLSLSDTSILVAATAVGMCLSLQSFRDSRLWPPVLSPSGLLELYPLIVLPQLACWSPAVLAIGLRRPRPAFRRLMREPGFVAVTVAACWMIFHGLIILAQATTQDVELMPSGWITVWLSNLNMQVCHAVGGAWVAMALARRWRLGRSGVDRLGFAIGLAWIAAHFFWLAHWFF